MKKAAVLMILLFRLKALAINEFGIGINLGFCDDPNNLANEIASYNTAIENYRENNAGVRNSQLTVPGALVSGLNLRYQFNYILFRAGAYYMKNLLESSRAEVIQSHTTINKIGIDTFQASSTFSLAMILPLMERAYVYFGGGVSLIYAYYRFFQSDPGSITGLPATASDTYAGSFIGFHFIAGMEFPITERFTLCAEWVHQWGASSPVQSENGTAKRTFQINSDIFLLGVNFYVRI